MSSEGERCRFAGEVKGGFGRFVRGRRKVRERGREQGGDWIEG